MQNKTVRLLASTKKDLHLTTSSEVIENVEETQVTTSTLSESRKIALYDKNKSWLKWNIPALDLLLEASSHQNESVVMVDKGFLIKNCNVCKYWFSSRAIQRLYIYIYILKILKWIINLYYIRYFTK